MRSPTCEKSRWASSESSRPDVPRAGSTCTSTPSGTSASSRAKRWRRAISKETRATSHGRVGTFSGRSIRPTWSTKTRSAPSMHGAAERDRVHDAAVEEVLVADLGRRQQARYGGAGHDRVDQPAGVEPVLGGALDAGRADLEPDGQVLEASSRRTPRASRCCSGSEE